MGKLQPGGPTDFVFQDGQIQRIYVNKKEFIKYLFYPFFVFSESFQ